MADVATASSPAPWRRLPQYYKEQPTEPVPQSTAAYPSVLTRIPPHSVYVNALCFRLGQLLTYTLVTPILEATPQPAEKLCQRLWAGRVPAARVNYHPRA